MILGSGSCSSMMLHTRRRWVASYNSLVTISTVSFMINHKERAINENWCTAPCLKIRRQEVFGIEFIDDLHCVGRRIHYVEQIKIVGVDHLIGDKGLPEEIQ